MHNIDLCLETLGARKSPSESHARRPSFELGHREVPENPAAVASIQQQRLDPEEELLSLHAAQGCHISILGVRWLLLKHSK